MRFLHLLKAGVLTFVVGLSIQGQAAPGKDAPLELKGIPARATPGDYASQAQAGNFTIAAEFTGHSLPTAEGPLTTEDYIGIEVALFGPAGARLALSASEFSLRLNGKKTLPSQPYGFVVGSLKDPEYIPPEGPPSKSSKTSLGGGGQGEGNPPPVTPKIPVPVQRAMAKRVQQASLLEGERALPQGGLIFFQYRGKTANLQSVELMYDGPVGKATLALTAN